MSYSRILSAWDRSVIVYFDHKIVEVYKVMSAFSGFIRLSDRLISVFISAFAYSTIRSDYYELEVTICTHTQLSNQAVLRQVPTTCKTLIEKKEQV